MAKLVLDVITDVNTKPGPELRGRGGMAVDEHDSKEGTELSTRLEDHSLLKGKDPLSIILD